MQANMYQGLFIAENDVLRWKRKKIELHMFWHQRDALLLFKFCNDNLSEVKKQR
jgi:hypothetical protein